MFSRIMLLFQWIADQQTGEMIESRREGACYTRDYLSFAGGISQHEGDALATTANTLLILTQQAGFVVFSCGEFFYAPLAPQSWVDLIQRQNQERP